ncbi:DNA translocase FtsK 4TM domain-containing protein [Natronospira sp. AB-CW4]|uniref:DNA translocase FtsK n=1 Tax=Natronospira bacteriovora TaxID=3069753 RepID=A0ABU0W9J5_9GAMM|nr:DNA translocase FtsK [Natronospira sp. AB-CW4]MDQ2070707.1 DNA translocase FtsK 4TM domain-containing protein [Natronospira sp. AB-CW4]
MTRERLAHGLRESAFWICLALALVLLAALASYNPNDPGFSHTGGFGGVSNWVGPTGAWIADFLLFLLGYPAYLLPVLVVWSGWLIFRAPSNDGEGLDGLALGLRFVGLLLAVATASTLCSMNWAVDPARVPLDAGGVLGAALGSFASDTLGYVGSTLILLALFFTGVTLFTGLSWLAVMDATGRFTLLQAERLRNRWQRFRQWLADRRKRRDQVAELREKTREAQKRKPPKIAPVLRDVKPSQRSERERQQTLFEPSPVTPGATSLPPLSLLDSPPARKGGYSESALEAMSRLVEHKLKDFGVEVEVVAVNPGPVVTRFELQPAPGVKVSQISNLSKDLARAMSAISVRVVEVIPGKSVVGLEIPNEDRELLTLGEILKSEAYDASRSPLTLALGKDISGRPMVADLQKMPHLLIAGTTGSGKSVAINAMILSLLYKDTPENMRLIMIDPKMLELSVYEGIPHLLAPVVTDMKDAANALKWCVGEMERRYRLMAALGVRNLAGYNRKIRDAEKAGEPIRDPLANRDAPPDAEPGDLPEPEILGTMPQIVVVIDELADMMMIVGKKVEELIARLAQKARASGIHLILATQRPSVDVITGLIKANIPARIAFQVSSRVDSRTILDQMGAESLLGHGDMLFLPPGTSMPERVHGAFVSDQEVHRVVAELKKSGEPEYDEDVLNGPSEPVPGMPSLPGEGNDGGDESDPLYDQAVRLVTETRKASISGVQRRLKIGYNRAARMIEQMEEAGIVGPLQPNGSREVLAAPPPGSE